MGFSLKKQKKVDRNDKWYVLAKEQGYRSRAAFKLAHINKEFDLITPRTRVVLDLCAAPGGWAQVAAKAAGHGAAVIAVDLLPIRPIPNVRTIVGDITLDQTHAVVRREAKEALARFRDDDDEGRAGRYVDCVLCDGAPNVGAAYAKDAFVQNEISLLALKCGLSCGLRRGGSFVTKVYRGQDYNALTWAFGRLFDRVRAHKPASSRSQSAEIFVVCTGYLAPQRVDPRLLDPKHVFSELGGGLDDAKPLSVLHPQAGKRKRHRDGYAANDSGLLADPAMSAAEFARADDPTQILAERSKITFDDDAVASHKATTAEVRACGADLKVLSKGDFRTLLKWREKLRKDGLHEDFDDEADDDDADADADDASASDEAGGDGAMDESDSDASEDEVQAQIARQRDAVARDARREKKRKAKAAAKVRARAGAGIVEESNVDEATREQDVFSFSAAVRVGGVDGLAEAALEEDEEAAAPVVSGRKTVAATHEYHAHPVDRSEHIEDQLDEAYEAFADRRAARDGAPREERQKRAKKYRAEQANRRLQDDMELVPDDAAAYADALGKDDHSSSDDDDDDDSASSDGERDPAAAKAAGRWFSNPLFAAAVDAMPPTEKAVRKEARKKAKERKDRREKRRAGAAAAAGEDDALHVAPAIQRPDASALRHLPIEKRGEWEARKTAAEDARGRELIKAGVGAVAAADAAAEIEYVPAADPFARRPQAEKTFLSDSEDDEGKAETLALATMMLRKSKAKQLVDASYNRYAWNDPKDLPSWFVDDEKRHYRPQLPIKPQLLAEMKQRFQSLAAKPIKKVAEARARKKTRADAKLKAARKKAEAVANDPDMSAGRKRAEVEKAMARAAKQKRPDKVYVVASKSKSGVKKATSTPKGATKGSRVVSVDARMKADKRAIRAKAKRSKKFKKGGKRH
mmetsp:Transcript_29122/g.90067  ORF Transcript_29122/g.90067 Transcript_29122/m.90067 type:complete len:920 (-) Transcript_29122:19-2778(-)